MRILTNEISFTFLVDCSAIVKTKKIIRKH